MPAFAQHIGRGKLSDNDNHIESSVVGSFGIERINDAVRRLRVFMETHQIAALSTFYSTRSIYILFYLIIAIGRTQFLNVHTKSTTFSLFVKICATLTYISDAGSVSVGQL